MGDSLHASKQLPNRLFVFVQVGAHLENRFSKVGVVYRSAGTVRRAVYVFGEALLVFGEGLPENGLQNQPKPLPVAPKRLLVAHTSRD